MNSKFSYLFVITALVATSGGLGLSLTGAFDDNDVIAQSNTATGLMMGHLTVEAHNEGGDMIAYRQTDNEVVDDGEQCILRLLFQENGHPKGRVSVPTPSPIENYPAGVNACIGELNGAWDTIAIGTDNDNGNYATGVAAATADTLVLLGNETSTSLGLQRGDATTKTWYNGTGSTPTKIVLSKTFTSDSPRAHAIGESGLFNSTTADANGMLARQTFTDVSLSDGDSITITWTFTVGN